MNGYVKNLINDIGALPEYRCYGSVCAVKGMLVEISGIRAELSVGDRCRICARGGKKSSAKSSDSTMTKCWPCRL